MPDALSCPHCGQVIFKPVLTAGTIRCGACRAVFAPAGQSGAPTGMGQAGRAEAPQASYGMLLLAVWGRLALVAVSTGDFVIYALSLNYSFKASLIIDLTSATLLAVSEVVLALAAVRLDRAAADAAWRSGRLSGPVPAPRGGDLAFMLPLMVVGGLTMMFGIGNYENPVETISRPMSLIAGGLRTLLLGLIAVEVRRWLWRMQHYGQAPGAGSPPARSLLLWVLLGSYACTVLASSQVWFVEYARQAGLRFWGLLQLCSTLALGFTLCRLVPPMQQCFAAWSRRRAIDSMFILVCWIGVALVALGPFALGGLNPGEMPFPGVWLFTVGSVALWACWLNRIKQCSTALRGSARANPAGCRLPARAQLLIGALFAAALLGAGSTLTLTQSFSFSDSFYFASKGLELSLQCVFNALLLKDLLGAAVGLERRGPEPRQEW